MNFYPRYVGDFARDTARLSLVEVGVYDRLLDDYYAQETPFPDDLEAACGVARARKPAECSAVRKVLDAFFPVGADGLRHNKRADEEIAKGRERIKTARNNGKKNRRGPTNQPGHPAGEPDGTQRDTQPGNSPSPQGTNRESSTALPAELTDTPPKATPRNTGIFSGASGQRVDAPAAPTSDVREGKMGPATNAFAAILDRKKPTPELVA